MLYVLFRHKNRIAVLKKLRNMIFILYLNRYWLLVAGCWLLAAGCWLLVAGCWLPVFSYSVTYL